MRSAEVQLLDGPIVQQSTASIQGTTAYFGPVVIGQRKQFLLMGQFDRADVEDIAQAINLAGVGFAASFPELPHAGAIISEFLQHLFYSPVTDPAALGTVATSTAQGSFP